MHRKIALTLCALLAVAYAPAAFTQPPSLSDIRALAERGEYESALTGLDTFLAVHPDDIDGQLYRGVLLQRKGDLDGAIETFRALAKAHPQRPEPLNNLAVLYAAQGRYADAHEALLKAIEVAPDYDTAHENLGDLHVRLAALAYRRAYQLNKDNTRARQKAEILNTLIGGGREKTTVSAAETPTPRRPASVSAAEGANEVCYTAQGFANEDAAHTAADWLRGRGDKIGAQVTRIGPAQRYLVYLPPFETREAAASQVQRMQAAGIRDIALITQGARSNAVSLGVFSTREHAQRRLSELSEQGYSAQSAPLQAAQTSWSVDVTVVAGESSLPEAFGKAFPGHTLRAAECPQ